MAGPDGGRRPLRLAHRGDHRVAPENSLAAFLAALELPGCDGLEFDVRLSRDGVPVVIHDPTLRRVQRRPGRVADLTADELATAGVPTLASVLAAVPRSAFLDIELKVDGGPALAAVLREGRGPGLESAVISSFELAALAAIRALEPAWPCWLNADDLAPDTIARAVRLGCAAIAAEWHAIDAGTVAAARRAGLEVAAWTVTGRRAFDRLAGLGVVAICVEGAALGPARPAPPRPAVSRAASSPARSPRTGRRRPRGSG